jgi:hypothetical protein
MHAVIADSRYLQAKHAGQAAVLDRIEMRWGVLHAGLRSE